MSTIAIESTLSPIRRGEQCDSACPAQARVAVRMTRNGLKIQFCVHHWNQHEEALQGRYDDMMDQRYDPEFV